MSPGQALPVWISSFLKWLNPRRLRAQAIVLSLCLWGVCAVDFATPGVFDRASNIKFQDFLPFYISAKLVAQHHAPDIYRAAAQAGELAEVIGCPTSVEIPYLYGPQVALLFVPLVKFSFVVAARIWAAMSVLIYFACVYAVWKQCPNLDHAGRHHPQVSRTYAYDVMIAALAFPPLFHVFVRGQISAVILASFTAAFLAFRADRQLLAGVAFGFLMLKPQFLVAIPAIVFLARAWRPFIGLVLSASAQLLLARLYFGPALVRQYFNVMTHPSRWIGITELNQAPIQMHSLRAFWTLLIPLPPIALLMYLLTSIVVIAIAAAVWKSGSPLAVRFSALALAAILVNPHLFIYDLLVLAPVLLLIVDWTIANQEHGLTPQLLLLSYLAFVLPLFGPISRWTHIQLSVVAFTALLWTLFCFATRGHKLASGKSLVV